MKTITKLLFVAVISSMMTACQTTNNTVDDFTYKVGDTVQALTNIHVDHKGMRIFSINYQSSILLPVCSQFTIDSIEEKAIKLTHQDIQYDYHWDKYTRKVRSLSKSFDTTFGDHCDTKKLDQLSKIDKDGLRQGKALIGMSKQGVIFAMGPPPIHANPSTQSDNWLYWRNRWGKRAIEFSSEGKVNKIR